MYYTSSITTNSRILCNHLHFLFIAYTIRIRTKSKGGGGSKIGKIFYGWPLSSNWMTFKFTYHWKDLREKNLMV